MPADSSQAVFLSYASQDAEAARRIAEALRASGVEVWFDRDELVGGDAWDAKIRKQIKECALFIPVISAATQARHEGYFRLEWKLAAQRTHMMSGAKAFLVPVVIDDTRDSEAHVPADFRGVQWTKLALPEVDACASLAAHVRALLTSENSNDAKPARPAAFNTESRPAGRSGPWRSRNRLVLGAGAAAIGHFEQSLFRFVRAI